MGNAFSGRREQTRTERHLAKIANARTMPVSVATVNFICDGNVGFVVRAMACFGATDLHIIGAVPSYKDLTSLSGGLNKYIKIHQHHTPSEFVRVTKKDGQTIMSVELDERSVPISAVNLKSPATPMVIVLGHETVGVPEEILHASDIIVHIPMPGVGFCLNTSQAGNIILYELAKQLLA